MNKDNTSEELIIKTTIQDMYFDACNSLYDHCMTEKYGIKFNSSKNLIEALQIILSGDIFNIRFLFKIGMTQYIMRTKICDNIDKKSISQIKIYQSNIHDENDIVTILTKNEFTFNKLTEIDL